MKHYILGDVVDEISERENNPSLSGYERFVGLEHYVSGDVEIKKYGTTENLNSAMKVFKSGDILVARRNVYLKRASVVYFDGLTSGDSIVLRAKNKNIGRVLPFILNTSEFWDYADQHSDGTMSKRLSPKVLKAYEFDLPDDNELEDLADLLWSLVDTKNAYEELLIKTDDLVKSQFIEMFANEEKTEDLDSCAYIKKGKTITRAAVVEGDIPVVAAGIEPSCYHNQSNRDAGIITISASGANAGYVNYWDVPIFASDCNTVLTKNAERLDNVFLFWRLRVMQEEIFGMKHGSGQPHVYAKDLKKIKVPIPSIDRQRQFTYMVEQSDKSKFELQQAIESIDNLIKSILYSNLEDKKE